MSGMFDAKTDKAKRKQELTQKEQKAKKKSRTITIIVTVVFLLAMSAAILVNSNWLRRTVTVVTIDGVDFNTAQFEYFYNLEKENVIAEVKEQGWDFILPEEGRSWARQIYNADTGETWADIVTERALVTMRDLVAVYNVAIAAGYQLPQERYEEIDNIVMMQEFYAQMSRLPSADNYLQLVYGVGMNSRVYREILEFVFIAEEYVVHIRDSFEYAPQQLDEYYAQNADVLDIFKYRAFIVYAEDPGEFDDYDAAYEEAMGAAREKAEDYAAGIESEEDFLAAALEYDELYYAEPEYTMLEAQGFNLDDPSYLDSFFASWLREGSRAYGDVTTIEVDNQGTAVLFYVGREDNNYQTAGMRQLLMMVEEIYPDNYPEGVDDPGYISALENAPSELRARAELVDTQFSDAGRTEQALIDLMENNSDDTTEGGLYEGISKFPYIGMDFYAMKVVPELEDWLFEDGRAVGDSELIESEAYGFHLVYFMGYGELFSRVMAEDRMRMADSTQWLENIHYGEPVRHGTFILVTT